MQSLELGRRTLTPELAERIKLATGISTDWLLGKSDDCTLPWGEAYDTGATFIAEDLLDIRALAHCLADPDNKVGRHIASLLPKSVLKTLTDFRVNDSRPVKISVKNLLALPEIVRRLRKPENGDNFGMYLRDRLAPRTKDLLKTQCVGEAVETLRQALASDLDRIIRSGPLYASSLLVGVPISKALLSETWGKPEGESLIRLNLRILCEAFSETIWLGPKLDPVTLKGELAPLLAKFISGRSIYDPKQFHGVALRTETKRLLATRPKGESLCRLNRLLLEDAFPDLIEREHGRGYAKWQSFRAQVLASQPGGVPRSAVIPGRSIVKTDLAFRLDVLLNASCDLEVGISSAIKHRLFDILHAVAEEFGLIDNIYRVLRQAGAKPSGWHPLDPAAKAQDPTWEWLFYGPPSSSEGTVDPRYAQMARQHEEQLRKQFKHWA